MKVTYDFEDAAVDFDGLYTTRRDQRQLYDEDRYITVGRLHDDVIVIVWTERDESRRVISMRKADRDERKDYQRLERSG